MEIILDNKENFNYDSKDMKNEIKKSDSFINFFENYYGYFKTFISKDDLFNIGKINRKLMSLIIIDNGNYLFHEKENNKNRMKKIIEVSIHIAK